MPVRHSVCAVVLSSLVAVPAVGQVRLGDQLEAIRLAGSEHMMIHTLSMRGLPPAARSSREQQMRIMGLRGEPGTVSYTDLSFSPVMTHDSNINGGYASDTFIVSGIPFSIGDEYAALSGVIVGLSGNARARIALGNDTALDLRAGGSVGYAPEHDMFKASFTASACLEHMVDYSTFLNACLDMGYRVFDLGESFRADARFGVSRVLNTDMGVHEARAELQFRHIGGQNAYTQAIANLSLTSAMPGPYVISAGLSLGQAVDGVMTMRERVSLGLGFMAFERPTSVSLAYQRNRGGRWLGQDLDQEVLTVSLSHQLSDRFSVTGFVSQSRASDSFFDDKSIGLNFSWRF